MKRLWFNYRFLQTRLRKSLLQTLHGLMDIAFDVRRHAEKAMQSKEISFMQGDAFIKDLMDSLNGPAAEGFYTRKFLSELQRKDDNEAWSLGARTSLQTT